MIKGNNNINSEQSHPLWGTLYVKRTECVLEKCHDFQAFNSLALLKMKKKFYKKANIIFDMPELGGLIFFKNHFSKIFVY